MAIIANTFLTFDQIGRREDLSNLIANISPEDTPLLQNARKGKVKDTLYHWQRDSLGAAGANAVVQGDDVAAFQAVTPTVRMNNKTQISRKTVIVADTLDAVDHAGVDDEFAYQTMLRAAELKRDQEFILHSNVGSVTGSSAVAPLMGTLGAIVGSISGTNVDKEATGTNPTDAISFTDPRNDGAQRAFTETMLKTVLSGMYTAGGNPDVLSVGVSNKSVVSGFTGIATKTFNRDAVKPTAIIGSADVYVGEFTTLSVIANRFQRARDAWLFDYDAIRVVTLRPYKVVELAKTGDAKKGMLIIEWGLKVDHEQRLGLVADLS